MSLAQITEKIRNDAQKEADEILSKAKAQADFITQKAGQECDEIKAGFDARFEAERPEIMKRREIVANLDVEKMMLRAKRDLIEYLNFCASLLDEAVSSRDEKVTVGAGEKYIDREWLAAYNGEHGSNLELSEERADIAGGFILVRGRTSIDCSWDMLIKVLQEKQESDVVKRLFPSE